MPSYFPEGNIAQPQDYQERSLQKINDLLYGGGGGGGGGVGVIYYGNGDPNGVVTGSVGNIYINLDSGSLTPKLSGNATNTGWNFIG